MEINVVTWQSHNWLIHTSSRLCPRMCLNWNPLVPWSHDSHMLFRLLIMLPWHCLKLYYPHGFLGSESCRLPVCMRFLGGCLLIVRKRWVEHLEVFSNISGQVENLKSHNFRKYHTQTKFCDEI